MEKRANKWGKIFFREVNCKEKKPQTFYLKIFFTVRPEK